LLISNFTELFFSNQNMSNHRIKGVKPLQTKLTQTLENKDFYQSLQIYKTIYVRFVAANKLKEAEELLSNGAGVMLEQSQVGAGTELSIMLFKHLTQNQTKLDKRTLNIVILLFKKYPLLLEPEKRRFINTSLHWVSSTSSEGIEVGQLHDLFGQEFAFHKEFFEAEKHYIKGTNPVGYADLIINWSSYVLKEEIDLLITRSILRFVALKNLSNATVVLDHFTKHVLIDSPLINFLYFLISTCLSGSRDVFQILRQKYKPSLMRDKSLNKYLDHIGKVFFGIEPSKAMGGLLGSLLQGMGM